MQRYELGGIYKTRNGGKFIVVKCKNRLKGYETVCDLASRHRYNRSTPNSDNGRTTGSEWTNNCLVYPPIKVGEVKGARLKLMQIYCTMYSVLLGMHRKICEKLTGIDYYL